MSVTRRFACTGAVVVLAASGLACLTVETESDLRDAVRRQLDSGRRQLVLDLARVPYVDSCGLGTMVQAYVSAHRAGGSVKLSNIAPRVRQLLTVTRLLTVFELYQPEARAVECRGDACVAPTNTSTRGTSPRATASLPA